MASIRSIIQSIPILGDIFDLRAETRVSKQAVIAVLKIAIPETLGGIFSITDLALKLLTAFPAMALIIWVGVPIALVIICISVISSRISEVTGGGFLAGPQKKYKYRFNNPERLTAKIALLPVGILAGYYIWNVLPNRITRQDHVAGFICRATDQSGVTDGVVEVLNVAGGIVSQEPQQLDDTGFFYGDLRQWGSRPYSLRLTSQSCSSTQIIISDSAQTGTSCPHDQDKQIDRPEKYKIWTLTCK